MDRLSPATANLLRRGVGRRLTGPHAFPAAVVLAKLRDRRAFVPLAARAFAPNPTDGNVALVSLGVLGDPRAARPLLALARRSEGDNVAFEALARLRDPATVGPLLDIVRATPTGRGTAAAYALAAFGGPEAARGLLALARSPALRNVQENFFVPLGRLGGPEVARYLLDRLEHGPEDRVQYAALGLGDLRSPDVAPELRRIAAGTGPRAQQAGGALGTILSRRSRKGSP